MLNAKRMMEFYKSGMVVRYHNRPTIKKQTTGEHSFGMLLLLEILHPNPSANLCRAIIRHDLPERFSGDFPHDTKKSFPILKEIDDKYQEYFEQSFGLTKLELSEEEKIWIKYLDQLEPIYFLRTVGASIGDEEAEIIVQNSVKICAEYYKQLQAFGYFKEPEATVH